MSSQLPFARKGATGEMLAQAILSCMAFTVRVPTTEDVGADFFCTVAQPSDTNFSWAGSSFLVQVKTVDPSTEPTSSRPEVRLTAEHAAYWFLMLKLPYFLCFATKEQSRIDLYSTWQRIDALMSDVDTKEIILKPEAPGDVVTDPEKQRKTIPLGPAVLSVTMNDVVDPSRLQGYLDVLNDWIGLDQKNISRASAHIHYTMGPRSHATNIRPTGLVRGPIYVHPKNNSATLNLFWYSAFSLREEYNQAFREGDCPEHFAPLRAVIDEVLRLVPQPPTEPAP